MEIDRRDFLVEELRFRRVVVEGEGSLLRDEPLVPDDGEHVLQKKDTEVRRRSDSETKERTQVGDVLTPSKSPPAS